MRLGGAEIERQTGFGASTGKPHGIKGRDFYPESANWGALFRSNPLD
jgi:hypothetical protein